MAKKSPEKSPLSVSSDLSIEPGDIADLLSEEAHFDFAADSTATDSKTESSDSGSDEFSDSTDSASTGSAETATVTAAGDDKDSGSEDGSDDYEASSESTSASPAPTTTSVSSSAESSTSDHSDSPASSSSSSPASAETASFKTIKVEIEDDRKAPGSDKYVEHVKAKPSDYSSEKKLGSKEDDELTGTDEGDTIFGRHGDDTIQTGGGDDYVRAGHGNDTIDSGDGDDFIKAGKGEDALIAGAGDDVIDGGHGNDMLDGGAGSDILNADKGEDTLVYTLSENTGFSDYYDGGKGTDTLVIRMTESEYALHEEELNELAAWLEENGDAKKSASKQFNDASHSSPAHPVFETSFGLNLRHIEDMSIEIIDSTSDPVEPEPVDPEPVTPPAEPEVTPPAEPSEPGVSEVTGTVTGDGPIPLREVDVSLAAGSQVTLDVTVNVEELPAKYDVFMLHDLSGSFWDDLPNVQAQFSGLYDNLTANGDVAFGVGSFVDKPMETFGSSYDYVYNTDLSVTSDKASIQETLDGLRTSSGWDWPESQMEALVQTALRDDEIGFRDGAQKFAVLFTDAPYHMEGDYDTRSVYDPETGTYTTVDVADNDYDTEFEVEDYPNPEVVGKMLIDAGITPVFAVTPAYVSHYQALVDSWGVGIVTELNSDSSNIADAITGGITDAPINLELDALGDDYGFVSSVEPPMYEDVEPGSYTFNVTLEIPEDSESYSSDSLTLEVTGYGEVNVDVAIEQIDITGDSTDDTLIGDAGPNAIYGLEGDDTLTGTGGTDQLYGGTGHDTLTGGKGDDQLTGGEGNDVFVFATGDGQDTITDFSAGDMIDLRRLESVSSFTEVLAAATQVDSDTILDFGNGDSVTLIGVNTDTLSEDSLIL
mgnify:CR=1 FL=1